MLVVDFLTNEFKPMQVNDSAKNALRLIDGFKLTHIPVFEAFQFQGNVAEECLEEIDENASVIDCKYSYEHFFLTENSSVFDALNTFYTHNTNIIPVFNNEEHYIGYLMVEDALAALSKMPFISEPGALMIVEMSQRQFSFSEIAKIVESNNTRMMGAVVSEFKNDKVQVLLKLSSENLTSVSETFERFGYRVVMKFFNDEKQEFLKERYEQLLRYLNT